MPIALSDAGFGIPAAVFPKIESQRYSINWKPIVKTEVDWDWVWLSLSRWSKRTEAK